MEFYAQPWGEGEFASQPGNPAEFANAVFIGEGTDALGDALAPVPAFCGGAANDDPCAQPNAPRNWEYAYTTWDTSKNGVTANSAWKFWVVVWAEYNGKLVAEVPGHGLQSIPRAPFASIGALPVETYSNNLGYYNQVFTVLPGSATAQQASATLKLKNIQLRSGSVALRDEPVTITATHLSSGRDIRSLLSLYYDGNPDRGGTLFDTQQIDRVPSGNGFVDMARYTPKSCGVHTIYVRSIALDGSVKTTTSMGRVKITIDPVESTDELIVFVENLAGPRGLRSRLLGYLFEARQNFEQGNNPEGIRKLNIFLDVVRSQGVAATDLAKMQDQVKDVKGCVD